MEGLKPETTVVVINGKTFEAVQYLADRDIALLSTDEKTALEGTDHGYIEYDGFINDWSWSRGHAYIDLGGDDFIVADRMWIVQSGEHRFVLEEATYDFLASR